MCNNKSLIQIEDLGRWNSKHYKESIQTSLLSIQIDKYGNYNLDIDFVSEKN